MNDSRPPALPTLPARPEGALTGSQVAADVAALSQPSRDERLVAEIVNGNIPDFLRGFVPVTVTATLSGEERRLTYSVLPDYLAVGSDDDFVRFPLNPLAAQEIADAFGCTLPTPRMVDDIYRAAARKLAPFPFSPATYDIQSVDVFRRSNDHINAALAPSDPGAFVGGIKKDVVVTIRLATAPGRVAIYGWHQLDGRPIQPLSTVHDTAYVDYSQCIRLVARRATLDGQPTSILAVAADPVLSALVSDEGPVSDLRYALP